MKTKLSSHRLVCINFSHPPPPPFRSRFSQVLGGATVTSYYYNEDVPGRRFFSADNWDRRMGMKNGATRWFCSAQRSWNPGQQVGGTIKSSSLFFFLALALRRQICERNFAARGFSRSQSPREFHGRRISGHRVPFCFFSDGNVHQQTRKTDAIPISA